MVHSYRALSPGLLALHMWAEHHDGEGMMVDAILHLVLNRKQKNPRESWFSRLFPPAFFNCSAHGLLGGAAWIRESSSLFFLSASTASLMTLCDLQSPTSS